MDEAERIDLALNSQLDSAFLDCWDDDRELGGEGKVGGEGQGGSPSETHQAFRADSWGASDRLDRFARLPSFNMDQGDDSQGSNSSVVSGDESAEAENTWDDSTSRRDSVTHGPAATTVTQAVVSANQSTTSSNARQADADAVQVNPSQLTGLLQGLPQFQSAMQLHPLAIQATANCPPHESASNAAPATDLQNSLFPLAMNAIAAGATLSHPAFLAQAAAMASVSAAAASQRQHQHNPLAPKAPRAPNPTGAAQPPTSSITSNGNPHAPPFMLFDAPIELRTNFEHAQRALGLPVLYDNNSYHFGFAVNGFHPQGFAGQGTHLRLVDARHGDAGDKRIKNAKEQRRAQKITELIDDLRDKMERDGWQVGIKSKYNTLACCADYIKHLVTVTHEKELAVKQARCDLEAKKKTMEDDNVQQDPSEPESTTSSLTVSSSSGESGKANKATSSETEPADSDVGSKSNRNAGDAQRKMRLRAHSSNVSSITSSGTSNNGSDDTKMSAMLCDQGSTSASDLGESNDETPRRRSFRSRKGTSHTEVTATSSDLKVEGIRKEYEKVLSKKRKRRGSLDPTSLDPDFRLDYEEVFVKSCVPQILASTAGRIVAWNDFFLKATGLPEDDVDKTTIFSLVQKDKLSTLFDIVAKSLRLEDQDPIVDAEKSPWDYSTVTLPCLALPSGGPQLFLTVTLMKDSDLRKRCFHCILTDSPCTDGVLGPITPELLKMLFTASRGTNGKKRSKGSCSRDTKV